MSKIKTKLTGEDIIDNAVIFFDDPQEKMPHFLNPKNDEVWETKEISIPMDDTDELAFSLHVVAFTGTKFKCVITNTANDKTIEFEDITGKLIKNRAITKGSKKFK